ncbi:MAG: hypothetical protein WC284_16255 [Candidimonas sp.]
MIKVFSKTTYFADHDRRKHDIDVINAFADGIKCIGDDVKIVDGDYEDCDIAVILYSPRDDLSYPETIRREIYLKHRPKDIIIIETPIYRGLRQIYWRVGYNHVSRKADFRNKNCPSDRWKSWKVKLKNWKRGKYIIVCGQLPGDYSLDGIDIDEWCENTIREIKLRTNRPIIFRPHPRYYEKRSKICFDLQSASISKISLEEDLNRAYCFVTYSSGSAVDAVINGTPSISLSESNMAWDVSFHSLDDLDKMTYKDRTQWAYNLAYTQWTTDEIRKGLAWKHLR